MPDAGVAVYSGNSSDYRLTMLTDHVWGITDLNPADGDDGYDELALVKAVQFNDVTISLPSLGSYEPVFGTTLNPSSLYLTAATGQVNLSPVDTTVSGVATARSTTVSGLLTQPTTSIVTPLVTAITPSYLSQASFNGYVVGDGSGIVQSVAGTYPPLVSNVASTLPELLSAGSSQTQSELLGGMGDESVATLTLALMASTSTFTQAFSTTVPNYVAPTAVPPGFVSVSVRHECHRRKVCVS